MWQIGVSIGQVEWKKTQPVVDQRGVVDRAPHKWQAVWLTPANVKRVENCSKRQRSDRDLARFGENIVTSHNIQYRGLGYTTKIKLL